METPRSKSATRLHYAYVVLAMSVLAAFAANGLGRFAYPVILPAMKDGLQLTYEQTGLLASANFVGYLLLSAIGGVIAAKIGPRITVGTSLLILGLSLFATGFVASFPDALAMRTISGLANGGAFVPTMALTAAWFGARKRGLASGFVTGGIGLGLVLSGLVLPGIMAGQRDAGWRFAWYVVGIVVLFIALACTLWLRNRPAELGLAPLGAEDGYKPSTQTVDSSDARTIYAVRSFWQLSFAYFLFGISYVLYSTFFAAYLINEGHLATAEAGALWATAGAISVISGSIWGKVSDELGRKYGLALVFLVQAAAYFIFAAFLTPAGYYTSAILFGLTAWSIPAIMAAACGDYVGPRLAPAALGSVTFFYGIGQALGPAIGGRIADATGSFSLPFYLAAGIAALGTVASLTLRPPAR